MVANRISESNPAEYSEPTIIDSALSTGGGAFLPVTPQKIVTDFFPASQLLLSTSPSPQEQLIRYIECFCKCVVQNAASADLLNSHLFDQTAQARAFVDTIVASLSDYLDDAIAYGALAPIDTKATAELIVSLCVRMHDDGVTAEILAQPAIEVVHSLFATNETTVDSSDNASNELWIIDSAFCPDGLSAASEPKRTVELPPVPRNSSYKRKFEQARIPRKSPKLQISQSAVRSCTAAAAILVIGCISAFVVERQNDKPATWRKAELKAAASLLDCAKRTRTLITLLISLERQTLDDALASEKARGRRSFQLLAARQTTAACLNRLQIAASRVDESIETLKTCRRGLDNPLLMLAPVQLANQQNETALEQQQLAERYLEQAIISLRLEKTEKEFLRLRAALQHIEADDTNNRLTLVSEIIDDCADVKTALTTAHAFSPVNGPSALATAPGGSHI